MRKLVVSGLLLTVLALSGGTAAATNRSCTEWQRICFARCAGHGEQCHQSCTVRATECKKTGCFFAIIENRQFCSLKKS